MASNVNHLIHSIVYISVIYVWDKVEPVHCIYHFNLWKCMFSVTIMHVKVLVFTAACNNSTIVWLYVGTANGINCACHEHMNMNVLGYRYRTMYI